MRFAANEDARDDDPRLTKARSYQCYDPDRPSCRTDHQPRPAGSQDWPNGGVTLGATTRAGLHSASRLAACANTSQCMRTHVLIACLLVAATWSCQKKCPTQSVGCVSRKGRQGLGRDWSPSTAIEALELPLRGKGFHEHPRTRPLGGRGTNQEWGKTRDQKVLISSSWRLALVIIASTEPCASTYASPSRSQLGRCLPPGSGAPLRYPARMESVSSDANAVPCARSSSATMAPPFCV